MFKNMKIAMKIGVGFLGVLALAIGIFVFVEGKCQRIDTIVHSIVYDHNVKVRQCNQLLENLNIVARSLRNIAIADDLAVRASEAEKVRGVRDNQTAVLDTLSRTLDTDEGKEIFAKVGAIRKVYGPLQERILASGEKGDMQDCKLVILGPYQQAQMEYMALLQQLIRYQNRLSEEAGKEAAAIASAVVFVLITVGVAMVLVSILLAWTITRAIVKPIDECVRLAEQVSEGRVDQEVRVDTTEETGKLKASMARMISAIRRMSDDARELSDAAVAGRLTVRADAARHQGEFREIVQGVNETLDAVVGFIDEIPTPVMVVDTSYRILYMNKAGASLGGTTGKALVDGGRKCREFFRTGDCGTSRCACSRAMADGAMAASDTVAKPGDIEAEISYTGVPVRDRSGKIVGALEIVVDQTAIKKAARLMDKIKSFQDSEIARLTAALRQVADRDLSVRVVASEGDSDTREIREKFVDVCTALNTAVENLDQALSQVNDATAQVSSASQQISAGSQSLAQGANEQASSLEEVSASLEEMSSMTRQNADNALAAKNLAGEADIHAKTGTEAMERMSSAINKIKESSDQTAKIIKTIDEIAMQTNLLALNAAVEAARAGEAGRGFAVVAEEVRNLAQRSAQAAKNTADMIGESVRNAEEGVKISQEVSTSFEKIATSSKKVNDLIAEIAAASKEQAQGIKGVNDAVSQMDKVTQQNAANAEESASASEELSGQSEELQSMVAQFRITSTKAPEKVAATHGKFRKLMQESRRMSLDAKPSKKSPQEVEFQEESSALSEF